MSTRSVGFRSLAIVAAFAAALFISYVLGMAWLAKADARTTIYGTWYGDADDSRTSYILVRENQEGLSGSGDMRDYEYARKLRDQGRVRGDFLLLRKGERHYVVRDEGALAQVKEYMAPMEETGRKQAEVGAKQSVIGAEQAKVGAKQGKIGAKQAALGVQQATAALSGESFKGSDYKMEELGRLQEELGRQQEELSRKMEPLSDEQTRLGKLQTRYSNRLQDFMEDSIPEWIKNGTAEKLD